MKRFAIAVLITAAAYAQKPDIAKLDRTTAPVSPEQRPFKLPPVTETKLANGLTVVMAEDARFPLVSMRLTFNAGTKRDAKGAMGVAAAVGAQLSQGTKGRTFRQQAEELDSLGATLTTGSTVDATRIGGMCLAENASKLLAIVADVARNASFPDAELALYKQNIKQNLTVARSQAAFLANEEFRKRLFGDHPYGTLAASAEAIDKLDRTKMAEYRDAYLVPNNAYLILVGKLPVRAQLTKMIEAEFGTWPKKDVAAYVPAAIPAAKKQLVIVDKPGAVQADVRIGRVAATMRDQDYMAEAMGGVILGAGTNSRLFLDIREKRGYAYDVHTEIDPLADTGTFSTVTQVRNEVAPDALKGILDHMDAMGKERVTKEELAGAKALANGMFLIALEPQAGLLDQLERMKILGMPKDSLETYTTRVNSVEPDRIVGVAKKYLVTDDDAVIVVGDAAKIEKALSDKIGKFEVVKPK